MVGPRRLSTTEEKDCDSETDNHHYKYVSQFIATAGFSEWVIRVTVAAMGSLRANQLSAVRARPQ